MPNLFAANGHLELAAFDPRCWEALQQAREAARAGGWETLRSPHAFIGILRCPDTVVARWGEYAGIDLAKLAGQMEILFRAEGFSPRSDGCPLHREFCSNGFIRLLQVARTNCLAKSRAQITGADIAAGILSDGDSVVYQSLAAAGLSCLDLATLLAAAEQSEISARTLA